MRPRFLALSFAAIAVVTLTTVATPVQARAIDVPATAAWKHAQSRLIPSRSIAGLARTAIADSGTDELDVSVQYEAADRMAWATIYVFKPTDNIVAIWFEQSRQQIEHRPGYTLPEGAAGMQPMPFAPVPGGAETGLRLAYPLQQPKLNGTSLAIAPAGDWLIAVRMSSTLLSPDGLDARLTEFLSGMRWPETAKTGSAASPVAPCTTALALKKAKLIKGDGADTLLDALMGGAIGAVAEKTDASPTPVFCKDATSTPAQGVYRPNEAKDRYLLALLDAGESIAVEPAFDLNGRNRVSVTLRKLGRDVVFPSFNTLPTPEQARALVDGGKYMSVTIRGDGDGNPEVNLPPKP